MKKLFSVLIALMILSVWVAPVMAEDPFCSRNHEWSGRQTFRADVNMYDDFDFEDGSTVQFKSGSDVDFDAGSDVDFDETPTFNESIIEGGVTRYTMSGTTVAVGTTYNTWLITRTAATSSSGVTLPQITAAIDGFEIMFKIVDSSGSTSFDIKPYSSDDAMEATQGTYTATYDLSLDAAGNVREWKASYIGASGTSNVWYLILDER